MSRYRWVLVALVVALVTLFFVNGRGAADTSYDSEELEFLGLINDYRQDNGVGPLILSDTLTLASERHSKDMGDYGFFAHDTVESSYYPVGSQPWDRMGLEGYDYNTARGENLAAGHETAEESFQAWRESPAHNEAMLNGDYRVIGIARLNVPGSVHGWYWTTDFGGFADQSSHAPGAPQDQEPTDENVEEPDVEEPDVQEPEQVPERDTGRIENGTMNGEGGWDQRAEDGANLILDDGYARLGGYDDGRDELRQKIRVTKTSRLAYVIKIQSEERRRPADGLEPADRMLVRITDTEGKHLGVLRKYTGADTTGWDRDVVDLSRFAGRTVYVSFQVRTDPTLTTTFYLDAVRLKKGEGRVSGP